MKRGFGNSVWTDDFSKSAKSKNLKDYLGDKKNRPILASKGSLK